MARYLVKRKRPSRVRETAAAYGESLKSEQPLGFKVTVNGRGRMVLPAEVRERLDIKDGDWLTLILEPNGEIRMLTGEVYVDTLVDMFRRVAPHIPPGRRLSDELIVERRREAAKEQREAKAMAARWAKKRREQ